MRIISFSQLIWLLVGLFVLSLFSVVVLDLRFYLAHSTSLANIEAGPFPRDMARGQVEEEEEEEREGRTVLNNYADNRDLPVKQDRQRDAKGTVIMMPNINTVSYAKKLRVSPFRASKQSENFLLH
jgi:hypothetical protein